MDATTISDMVGQTMAKVTGKAGEDAMTFESSDGRRFVFYHSVDCCESVDIEDICGDLSDLEGSPIVLAEEVSNADAPKLEHEPESFTWTFYRFATVKGTVTVRWLGTSNGYYSECVCFRIEAS